jgi:hypothetical protein
MEPHGFQVGIFHRRIFRNNASLRNAPPSQAWRRLDQGDLISGLGLLKSRRQARWITPKYDHAFSWHGYTLRKV